MAEEFNEETQFVSDDVSAIVREVVERVIGGSEFSNEQIENWTSEILNLIMVELGELHKPFKYTVNCAIMEKVGAGLHTVSSCNWDIGTDGCCAVRWENKWVLVLVSVFGLTI